MRTREDGAKRTQFYDDVGRCIREMRVAAGMSQRELAEACKVGQSQIGLVESGTTTCSLYLAAQIAEALDCTLEDIARVTIDQKEAAE